MRRETVAGSNTTIKIIAVLGLRRILRLEANSLQYIETGAGNTLQIVAVVVVRLLLLVVVVWQSFVDRKFAGSDALD